MPITLNSNSSAPTEGNLRTINVVNPFYAVTTSSDSPTSNLHFSTKTGALFQWPLSPTTSSVSWMRSRQITPPSRSSTKRCKSPTSSRIRVSDFMPLHHYYQTQFEDGINRHSALSLNKQVTGMKIRTVLRKHLDCFTVILRRPETSPVMEIKKMDEAKKSVRMSRENTVGVWYCTMSMIDIRERS